MTQRDDFAKPIAFAWWPIFKMVSFLLVFFERFFAHNNSKWFVEWILTYFLEFKFLTQSDDFAKAIAFAWWTIFKMVSFLEYLMFFGAVFCTQQFEMICRMDFDMFFGILYFDPKWWFCKGYSLCLMAYFQNGLISRIFRAFWSGSLHTNTGNDL